MKKLNSIEGFKWVTAGNNNDALGKACIGGEGFWLRECKKQKDDTWIGIVDNDLLFTNKHNLKYNDKVSFQIEIGK